MRRYIDTSVLVAAFTQEASTALAQAWLAHHADADAFSSEWTVTEFSSALSVKLRKGGFSVAQRDGAQHRFDRMMLGTVRIDAVEPRHFRLGAALAGRHEQGLRAGDALHLAICIDHGATLFTLDRRLASAGQGLGHPAMLIA